MTIQTTSNLSNSIRTRYISDYVEAAQMQRLYDLLAAPVERMNVERDAGLGSAVQVNFLSDMTPGTGVISQTQDITPQILRDATATISPTSRGEALQWAEELEIKNYTNYGSERFKILGKNMMESVDILARDVALQGGFKTPGTARASLDAGASGDRLSDTAMHKASTLLQSMKVPAFMGNGRRQYFAIMHPDTYFDLFSGGNIISIAQYQDKEIWFGGELGQFGAFKLIVSPFAKVFGSAGADHASNANTTLSSAANALAKQIVVAADTNITAGMYLTIGTEETGNTHYPTNELVRVSANYSSGTTVDIIGEGANGGLRFDHASGESVRNADNAYPVVYGGPMSIAKLYDAGTGEYGKVVGPKKDGILDQFATIGWKFYGGYGRWVESWVLRGEYSSSVQA